MPDLTPQNHACAYVIGVCGNFKWNIRVFDAIVLLHGGKIQIAAVIYCPGKILSMHRVSYSSIAD